MVSYKSKKERGINSWSYCSIINVCCWWVTCVNLCLMRVNNIWDFKISYNKFRFSNNKALLDVKLIFPWKRTRHIYCPTRLYHPYDSSWYIYRIRIHYVGVLHLFHELQVLRSNKDELQSGFLNVKSSTQLPIFNIFTHTRR